jgi:hypothetical protein
MKLPLAMFARAKVLTAWARRHLASARLNPARGLLVTALGAAICGAGLVAPAAVDAEPTCQQWSFDGYTEFNFPDGAKMNFVSWDPLIEQETDAWYFPPDGGRPNITRLIGHTYGNTVWFQNTDPRTGLSGSEEPYPPTASHMASRGTTKIIPRRGG